MTDAVIPFAFDDALVRILMRDGEPWFVLADVCRVLEIGNPSQAAKRLDDDEQDTLTNDEGIAAPQVQSLTIINESGLYTLIMRSRKPEAKRFRKWVTAEVLPSIRKTGSYGFAAAPRPLPDPAPGEGPTVALNAKVAAVREYRSLFGPVRARALWRTLGLPEPDRVTVATPDAEDAGARAHLLAAPVPDGRTLAEAIAAVRGGEAETGRRLTRECWLTIAPEGVWLAYQCPFAIEAFAGTVWDNGGWRDAFRRLPGRLPGKVRAFGRYRAQSLHVPVYYGQH